MLEDLNRSLYPRIDRQSAIRYSLLWTVSIILSVCILGTCVIFVIQALNDSSISSKDDGNVSQSSNSLSNLSQREQKLTNVNQMRQVSLSNNAIELSPNMYYLGTREHPRYGSIKGWVVVRRQSNSTSTSKVERISQNQEITYETAIDLCSTVLSPGTKWKRTANFVLDPKNSQGLSEEYIMNTLNQSMSQWNELLVDFKVFGGRDTYHTADRADLNNPSGLNEIFWAKLDNENVIAYTSVWAIYDGPIEQREIVEADIVFNDNLKWGDASIQGSSVMDGINTGTHEAGHFSGMSHSSNRPECQEDTMAPYSNYGEIKKRTLSIYDKIGFCNLYKEYACSLSISYSTNNTIPKTQKVGKSNGTNLIQQSRITLYSMLIIFVVFTYL